MTKKIVTVLKYIVRICRALVQVITGKKNGCDCDCSCTENQVSEEPESSENK